MSLQQNTDHIQTTHIGSLPRPHELLDLLRAQHGGAGFDAAQFDETLARSVTDCVRKQVESGIEIVTDGEYSKPGFFTYVAERLEGFEPRPGLKGNAFQKEIEAFPEYYEDYLKQAMLGGAAVPMVPVVCVGPVKYRGEAAVRRDIANLKAAAKAAGVPDQQCFLPATSAVGVGPNEYYKTEEEYLFALAAEMNKEYRLITEAGLLVQIDQPFLADIFVEPDLDAAQMKRRAQLYAEVDNVALQGVPAEMVRFHTCYGINEGPRIYEADLAELIGYVFQVNAGSFSFEGANPRHEHEYHLFERVKVPDGKVICPGVITHASNIVEHPQMIAERLLRFAKLVGRENVIAGADCGFSSQASYRTEVHPTVVWAKFKAMRQGADLASRALWG